MSESGARRRLDDAQLVERSEDDSSGWPKLGFEDLEHRDLRGMELQNPSPRTSRRIVYSLGQFDDVEFVDLLRYCHSLSMLGGGIRGHQSWCGDLYRVMPRDECQGMATIDGKPDFNSASCAVGRLANLRDRGLRHRVVKDPLQLASFVPDVLSAGKGGSDSRWPGHGGDARKWRHACVRHRSILRVSNHIEAKRGR
jgi:hypothetical protein